MCILGVTDTQCLAQRLREVQGVDAQEVKRYECGGVTTDEHIAVCEEIAQLNAKIWHGDLWRKFMQIQSFLQRREEREREKREKEHNILVSLSP